MVEKGGIFMAIRAVFGWRCECLHTGDLGQMRRNGGGGAGLCLWRRDGSRWKCRAVVCEGSCVKQVEDDSVGVSSTAPPPPPPVVVHRDLSTLPSENLSTFSLLFCTYVSLF